MPAVMTEKIRNIVLMGHSGSGKTSLADAMFFTAGGTTRLGKVEDGTSISDFEPEERERKISVQLSVLPCDWKGHRINVLDTPGYPDFKGEVISAATVADCAVIVVAANSVIEAGALQAWKTADAFNLPKIVVVNKVDRVNVDFGAVCQEIAETWGQQCIPLTVPDSDGPALASVSDVFAQTGERRSSFYTAAVEAVANAHDDLILKYLAGEPLTYDEIKSALPTAYKFGCITPILASSATSCIGVSELMNVIGEMAPSPADSDGDKAIASGSSVFVFKTRADPYVGRLSMFRVFGSPIESNSRHPNRNSSTNERFAQLHQVAGGEMKPVDRVETGDFGVVSKLSHTRTFEKLGDAADGGLSSPELPVPVFSLALAPVAQPDMDRMPEALSRICDEDPTLKVVHNAETGETVLQGLGETHLATVLERIKRKFDVSLTSHLPKIVYKETISSPTRSEYRHRKQSGGHGQYGHVVLQMEPAERGHGITFQSKVVGGSVPKEYIPAVEKGIRRAASEGGTAEYEVVDIDVTLLDGSSHSVDSSSMAFEIAAVMCFKQGVRDASPQVLEPVYELRIIVPEDAAGDVITDLNSRRARITNVESYDGANLRISALAPESAIQRYATDLRSLTQSRADYLAEFAHYETVPVGMEPTDLT